MALAVERAAWRASSITDYADRGSARRQPPLGGWMADGRLRSREDVVRTVSRSFPDALLKLFSSENTGKLVLAV